MNLLSLLARQSPNKLFFSLLSGALAGIGYALLIPIAYASMSFDASAEARTYRFLSIEVSDYKLAALFFATCCFTLLARLVSELLLSRITLKATAALREIIYGRILQAPIANLERIGSSRLLATITTDVPRIVNAAGSVPGVIIAFITLFGMLVYLFLLSSDVFWFVIGSMLIGIVIYQVPISISGRYFDRGRVMLDALHESVRGIIHGTKELKLNAQKQDRYFADVLMPAERAVFRNAQVTSSITLTAVGYGSLLSFLVIGIVIYILVNYRPIGVGQLTGAVMVMLAVTGPLTVILNSVPQMVVGRVSIKNIDRLFQDIPKEALCQPVHQMQTWDVLSLQDVTYEHRDGERNFKLGPISAEFRRGQVTFIVGGNGSGKSTLAKLISLHYAAQSGSISFGSTDVNRETLSVCRGCISAIFTDCYLFDRLLSGVSIHDQARVDAHLVEFGLNKQVKIESGRISTLALSDGQKKRLALLAAVLEDRDLYIFDEWTAEQDPSFRRAFYLRIVQELKASGKAVIVITHDDRYFEVADQILFMEDGRLVRTSRQVSERQLSQSATL